MTRVLAERLDRLHVQLLAVELDAGLLLDGVSDVGHGDRAEQLALAARTWPRCVMIFGTSAVAMVCGALAVLRIAQVAGAAHRAGLVTAPSVATSAWPLGSR